MLLLAPPWPEKFDPSSSSSSRGETGKQLYCSRPARPLDPFRAGLQVHHFSLPRRCLHLCDRKGVEWPLPHDELGPEPRGQRQTCVRACVCAMFRRAPWAAGSATKGWWWWDILMPSFRYIRLLKTVSSLSAPLFWVRFSLEKRDDSQLVDLIFCSSSFQFRRILRHIHCIQNKNVAQEKGGIYNYSNFRELFFYANRILLWVLAEGWMESRRKEGTRILSLSLERVEREGWRGASLIYRTRLYPTQYLSPRCCQMDPAMCVFGHRRMDPGPPSLFLKGLVANSLRSLLPPYTCQKEGENRPRYGWDWL